MTTQALSYMRTRLGAMMFLGGTPLDRDLGSAAPNHSNRVVFDEEAMAAGVAVYAGLALAGL